MAPLRIAIIVLIFANLLALALWKGWLGGAGSHGEPERLSNQLNPERIHLVSAQAPPAVPPVVARPAPAEEEAKAPAALAEVAVEALAPQACVVFAGLNAEQARELAARISKAGTGFALSEKRSEVPSSWWVHIPSQGSKEGADKKVAELRRLGVDDLFVMQDAGPGQYAISLGLYKNEAAANRHLESLKEKGVRSAQIATRGAGAVRIEVRGPGDGLATLVSDLSERLRGASRLECAP
ncbi:SPOR domain-containing protein [Zoogloea sp.]|uniref:SPOR domain-containing protein n=1 Tax=Zoogloea sp. TaxID=49181 RepID=UPI0014159B72|nr:MAG: SPOR domain-containing protein [Zoogloea sp.]